jgi:hypothetical protein
MDGYCREENMRKFKRLALLAILPLTLAGCNALGIGGTDDRPLRENRARWESRAPERYSFVMQRSCFCGSEMRDPVLIVVDGDVRVSATYVATGEPVRSPYLEFFPTMDGVFDILAEAYDEAHKVDVRYNSELGFPVQADIDYMKNAIDDEVAFTITDVRSR